ncbi:MAG: 3-isopropylmalate dehydratase small subunit [Chloroflexi bacterium]|nr:3-isopropylmalate dehydratase small subunit [Chloroflexota bacterium]
MEKFTIHTGKVVPLYRPNVDTDQIIPAVHLKRIERTGWGQFLFERWRQDPAFVLNRSEYQDGTILVAGESFGIGSSREHAPWSLQQYGFKAIVAPSFGDIFFNNSAKNGLLLIRLPEEQCKQIADWASGEPGFSLTIDLEQQTIDDGHGMHLTFDVEPFRKHCLLNGLDDIGLTLAHADDIAAFEQRRPAWLPITTLPNVELSVAGR